MPTIAESLREDLASLPDDVRTGYYIVIEPTTATDKVQVSFGLKLGKTGMDFQPAHRRRAHAGLAPLLL